jgi:SET domain-containing protein
MTKINHSITVTSQCAYKNDKGTQCKTLTSITHPYCPKHTETELHFIVAPSNVPFAGLGLYTTKAIAKDEVALFYEGEKLTVKEYNERYDEEGFGEYGMTLGAKHVIDARKTSSGLGRYICDYTGGKRKANVKYVNHKGKIEIIAKRDIEAGEELLVSYGKEMRTAMGFQPNKKERKKMKESIKKFEKKLKKSKKEATTLS